MAIAQITKSQLITQINNWGTSIISSEQLQDWMITHYDPPEVEVGLQEALWTQEAMNIVMNEYELAKINKFRIENFKLAISFIECNEINFITTRQQFLQNGFSD
jgi:hypothetical protein